VQYIRKEALACLHFGSHSLICEGRGYIKIDSSSHCARGGRLQLSELREVDKVTRSYAKYKFIIPKIPNAKTSIILSTSNPPSGTNPHSSKMPQPQSNIGKLFASPPGEQTCPFSRLPLEIRELTYSHPPPQHRCDLQSNCGPRTRQVQVPNTRNRARTSTHLSRPLRGSRALLLQDQRFLLQ
jgi:hypothetical protein